MLNVYQVYMTSKSEGVMDRFCAKPGKFQCDPHEFATPYRPVVLDCDLMAGPSHGWTRNKP